jgi:hypothetical protein
MMRYLGAFAMAATLLVAAAAEPVSAQKTGGILKMYLPDTPASMSIHESDVRRRGADDGRVQ